MALMGLVGAAALVGLTPALGSLSPDSGVPHARPGVASSFAHADSILRLWVPSARATAGGRVELAVRAFGDEGAPPVDVLVLAVRFDPAILDLESWEAASFEQIAVDTAEAPNGTVRLALELDEALATVGAHELVRLLFQVRGGPGLTTSVDVEAIRAEHAGSDRSGRLAVQEGLVTIG